MAAGRSILALGALLAGLSAVPAGFARIDAVVDDSTVAIAA